MFKKLFSRDTASEMESEKISQMIPEEEMQRMKEALKDGNIADAADKIKEALEKADNVPLNIAVTGPSGSGKSTFINAMRGLGNEDEGAAETGVVETTKVPTPYPHPQHKNVIYWDLPGIGTPNFKANKYLREVEFEKYDFFIIIANERFTENDVLLAEAIHSQKKLYYFARSKIDRDLSESKQSRPKSYNENKILKEIREDCSNGLRGKGVREEHIFLISSHYPHLYDFPQLQEALENDLPDIKKQMFIRCLPNISFQVLEKKRKALKQRIWQLSLVSAGVAAIPVPGLSFACDITILVAALKGFQIDFGLTESGLRHMAYTYNKDVKDLKSVIKSRIFNLEITRELVIKLLISVGVAAAMVVEYFLSLVPVVGTLAAAGISFGTTYWMLDNFLKEIADDAVSVLTKALEDFV